MATTRETQAIASLADVGPRPRQHGARGQAGKRSQDLTESVAASTSNTDSLFTLDEAQQILKIGRTLLFQLLRDGDMQRVRIHRRTFVRGSEIERYLRGLG